MCSTLLNKKGMALLFVLLIMVVMSTLAVAVFTFYTVNINSEKLQENAMRAHYAALSGVEVTFGALLTDNRSLLNNYFDKDLGVSIAPLSDTIELEGTTADIVVSSFVEDGERWVKITSTGRVNGLTVTKVIEMSFRIEHPEIQRWQ